MNLHNAEIVISAVERSQYPATSILEFALAGRSNVGKSSFINRMLNRKSLARTSGKPGKTATINFYNIDDAIMFVDLPGYGYAEVSKSEKEKWAKMIDTYLRTREQLVMTIQVVDARHKPSVDDKTMHDFIKAQYGYSFVIATKTDKLSKSKVEPALELIYRELGLDDNDILMPFSAEKVGAEDEVWEIIKEIMENHG